MKFQWRKMEFYTSNMNFIPKTSGVLGITELYVYLLPNYWVINGKTCVALPNFGKTLGRRGVKKPATAQSLPNCESYWAIMEEVSHECPTLRKKLRKKLRKNVA